MVQAAKNSLLFPLFSAISLLFLHYFSTFKLLVASLSHPHCVFLTTSFILILHLIVSWLAFTGHLFSVYSHGPAFKDPLLVPTIKHLESYNNNQFCFLSDSHT